MTGHPDFERANRVHVNTLENLIIFIPAVWIFATLRQRALGGGARVRLRRRARVVRRRLPQAADKRGVGAGITGIVDIVLVVGALVGLARALV